ncbi:MAG: ABC transporter permease, partial [Kiritimatiellae bacterium]|nr:ABC transporter permease [Kiritimatiellia bacterium]
EFTHVLRDARSLGMAIGIPMMMLFLFGYALTLDVDNVPVAVWDRSGTAGSREFISHFAGSRYFSIRKYVSSFKEIELSLDSRKALMGLVIPENFDEQIKIGRRVPIQLIVDGSDANTSTIAIGYAEAVALMYSQAITIERSSRISGAKQHLPLEVRPRVWFNPDMESKNFIIPGLIAVIMMVMGALLTSLTVAREWENGTMEQLISTPVKSNELILGKLIPYFAIGMVDVALAVLMGEFLFMVPLRGNVALLFAMAAIFLAGILGAGILISIATRNQLVASQLAMVTTFLPAFLLSGFVFSIANMPHLLQIITYIIPARYFVSLLKGIYLKGIGLAIMGGEALLLAFFGVVVISIAHVKFKKKLG